jgi:predicted ester cyclase
MSRQEQNKELVRTVIERALNEGDLDYADEVFHPDYISHVPRVGEMQGPEGFKNVISIWHRACPDFKMTIEELVADGDFVANRFTTRGTNTGSLLGFEPTGKSMIVYGQELHRIQDGQVAESWICDDIPSIMLQLGLIEEPAWPAGGPPGGA